MIKMTDWTNPEGAELAPILHELRGVIDCALPQDGMRKLSEAVWVSRASGAPSPPVYAIYDPVLCIVAQGSKEIRLGDERFVYDPTRCLLNTVTLPVSSTVIDASPRRPFLSVSVILDPALVRSVIVEAGLRAPSAWRPLRAMEASRIDAPLLECVLRLTRLYQTTSAKEDAGYLAPLALREVVYRLLTGGQGARLYQSVFSGGQVHQVVDAIAWMRENFAKPLRIETLARDCGMSPSGLHHHFKSVTAMSPLQFQKQLRLQEARRLMIAEGLDAAGAGFKVGYDDPSYFSRDYKRLFGTPPFRDVTRLKGTG